MTSPAPMSVFQPTCSYCWEDVDKPILLFWGKDLHWACSEKCKKGMLKDYKSVKEDVKYVNRLLRRLIEMYVEMYGDNVRLKKKWWRR